MLKKEEKNINNDEVMAFLGNGTEFKGIITYDGTIRIDGRVEGEIITKGTLIIGKNAKIDAKIDAGTVISAGEITGNINASDKIQLQSPAVLTGSMNSPIITIEEGVTFNGSCEMKIAGSEHNTPIISSSSMENAKEKSASGKPLAQTSA